MVELFSLGDLFVSDFIKPGDKPRGGREPLKMMFDPETTALRLESPTDPNKMYGQYWYRSAINDTMVKELKSIAEKLPSLVKIDDGDVFLDIACNDGTLLKYTPSNMIRVGVDPADSTYTKESRAISDDVIQDYFSEEAYRSGKFGEKQAKIVTIIAMFYDVDDPMGFLNDVEKILDDDGLLVIQMSYTPLMIRQLAFDNICHEHIYYYNLTSITRLLSQVGMKVVDCKLNDINGGSFRVYARKCKSSDYNFATSPFRDVAQYRIESILNMEEAQHMTTVEPYLNFYEQICKLREQTMEFIREIKTQGKSMWCYGASTKGNTLLQWYGLNDTLVDGIAERSPFKFGLRTIATDIPIYSEEYFRAVQPDYALMLPWHFVNEFTKREEDYLNKGGKFIVPCPEFKIIEKGSP